MRKSPRRKKPINKHSTTLAEGTAPAPLPAQPNWRLGTAKAMSPAVVLREPLGALHQLALARLPYHVAMELVGTVAESHDSESTLIDAAVPSLRTLIPSGHVSVAESERLLHVGRLFVILEAAYGKPLARALLVTPLAGLGNRSALQCSDSVASLELACSLLVPFVQIQFGEERKDVSE